MAATPHTAASTVARGTSDTPLGDAIRPDGTLGTTYKQARSLPSPSQEAFEVTEFEPDRRLAIRGDLGPFEGTLTYDVESVPDGTKITNSADLQGRGLLKVAAPLASGRVGDAVAANLHKLKEILER